jgi:uncharacterized Tic20 family protein
MSDPTPPSIPPVPAETPYTPPARPIIPPVPASHPTTTANDQTMGMICHLSAFAGVIIPFPFANLVGPLVMWMTQKDKSSFLDYHGKESLNFQITVAIAVVIAMFSMFILIGFLLLPAVGLYAMVMTIIAGVKAKEGVLYRYPYTLRLVK